MLRVGLILLLDYCKFSLLVHVRPLSGFISFYFISTCSSLLDADPGPWDPCVVAETRQIHTDYRVLWRKRGSTATLSRGERLDPCLDRLFYCFSGHITLRMILICYAQVCFKQLQKTKERMLLITSERKDIFKCKRKSG